MGSDSAWEQKVLTDELAEGMEKAVQLQVLLCSTSRFEAEDLLVQSIISSFEKALYILKRSGQAQVGAPSLTAPESSVSVDGSPRSEDTNKNFRDHHNHVHGDTPKKRKLQPTWTEQVKVNSENGLEGPPDDGYSWRKYGQKDILGAKYPRSYYRCTYRAGQSCWATKQVQRSDDDPTLFEIMYRGTHTCNLRVNTEHSGIQEIPPRFSFPSTFACHDRENQHSPISALADDNLQGTYSQLFYSPATSESNFFSAATYQTRNYGNAPVQHSETDTADIISAHASITNSPIGGMEFPINPVDLDPNLPFNITSFFT